MNIEHPNYTLIAYKSDGFSVCMGHVNETFSSAFELHTQMNMDECLTKHAALRRTKYEEDEPTYDLTVLYRGVPITEVGGPIYDLYMAALEAEVEEQDKAARISQAEAARQVEEQREIDDAAKRAVELNAFFATAKRLNFDVTPHQPSE